MSVFGVDLGALNSVVAVTRQGGVDIVCNEVSKRETATFVSYMGEERLIGEAGYDKAVRNASNTIAGVKRLIGLMADDSRVKLEKRFLNCATAADANGRLQLEVDYNNDTLTLYPEQVLAAFLGKLKKYVHIETKLEARDCVVTVPVWFTAEQRRLVIQACEMAGLHSLSLINETTAACVDYGIFRGTLLPEAEADASVVALIDLGYGGATVTVAKFWRGNVRVLAHDWDHELGTREVDWALYTHFASAIKAKYHVDVTENKRARIRLLQACDKLKCMLSANAQAPMNVENLMDVDVNIMFTREEMEPVIASLCDRIKALGARALAKAGVEGAPSSVEVIGGGSRIPAFKQAVSDAFGVPASFTLNASESIARGAAITAAMFSPLFQVREYVVYEAPLCPLMVGYYSDKTEAESSVPFLPNVNKIISLLRDSDRYPKTLELTFQRSDAFELYAFYDPNHDAAKHVPSGDRSIVGHWTVGGTSKPTNGSVKVRVKFLANGLVSIDSAQANEVYDVEVDEPIKHEEGAEVPADAPKTQKVKKQHTRKVELTVTPQRLLGLSSDVFLAAQKAEAEQDARDLTIVKTREVRNELEGYVYDNRSRIADGDLAPYVTDADRKSFVQLASEIEEWLYGDGDSAPLKEYQARLDKLKVVGAAAIRRLRLSEDIPFAHGNFEKRVQMQKDIAENKKGKEAHITDEDIAGAIAKCDEALAWGRKELEAFQAKPKYEDPALAPSTFDNKAKETEAAVKAVVTKKPPPPPKKEEKKAEKTDDAASPAAAAADTPKGPDAPQDLD